MYYDANINEKLCQYRLYLSAVLSKVISSSVRFGYYLNLHLIYFGTAFESIDNENLTKSYQTSL